MEYAVLGRTGLRVSTICLGTAFRGQWDDGVCAATVTRGLEQGINFIDTANVYGEDRIGHAEMVLGAVLEGRRDQVVLATKICAPVGEGPNDRGLSRVHLLRELDRSLERLRTDFVDILYLHEPDDGATPLEEALRSADAIVSSGKARYIGLSRFPTWQAVQALWLADHHHWNPVAVLQQRYNLIYREAELECLPFVREFDTGLVVFSPLAIGLLSGRIHYGQPPPSDTPWAKGYTGLEELLTPQTGRVVEELERVSRERNRTPAQVAIAWILSHAEVTSVIIGPDTPEQVDDCIGAVGWFLNEGERKRLDDLSAPTWARRP